MKGKETVQALRICATHIEKGCGLCPQMKYMRCTERLADEAITMIERLTDENAALKKEIRKAGCMFCARFEDRPEGFKPVSQEDCDNCTKKPDCACKKCSGIGSSTDNWEWRGLTEEHNGKENS